MASHYPTQDEIRSFRALYPTKPCARFVPDPSSGRETATTRAVKTCLTCGYIEAVHPSFARMDKAETAEWRERTGWTIKRPIAPTGW